MTSQFTAPKMVLIACEFSGIVREAFNALGHDATSCDLLPTEIPGQHCERDITEVLSEGWKWDLMISFPPCTHTAVSGARWFRQKEIEQDRAIEFFQELLDADIPQIAIEHPVSVISTAIRPPDQYIQPWQYGHGETKKTGYWLKNLPELQPTNIVAGRQPRVHHESPGEDRWKNRSRTLTGIADAMADQWGGA